MKRQSAFTNAEIQSAFKAARTNGMRVAFEVLPDGTRRIEGLPLQPGDARDAEDINDAVIRGTW